MAVKVHVLGVGVKVTTIDTGGFVGIFCGEGLFDWSPVLA